MPNFTPGFALPYPDALDSPCDFAEQWCDFSAAFQEGLDGFQAILDRTNPTIPIARLLVTTPTTMTSGTRIIYDTLSVDTASWVDFDANPSTLIIDRGGIFVLIASATTLGIAGGVVYTLSIGVDDGITPAAVTNQRETTITGQSIAFNAVALIAVTVPTTISTTLSCDFGGTLALERATLSVFWHSDRAAP